MRSGTLSRTFFQLGLFTEFSLYIIIIASRNNETEMWGVGSAQRPVLRVKEPKKRGSRSARAHAGGHKPITHLNKK